MAIATRLNGIQEKQPTVRGERPPAVSAGFCGRTAGGGSRRKVMEVEGREAGDL